LLRPLPPPSPLPARRSARAPRAPARVARPAAGRHARRDKARYRELARRHRPDANGGDARAHARFRAIAAAYQELAAADAAPPAGTDGPVPTSPIPAISAKPPDGLNHRRTELRTRLARVTRSFRRAQADARDGATKAVAARARGDEAMARHFDRRVETDWGRADGLRGEIAAIKQELRLITSAAGPRRDEPAAGPPPGWR